MREFYNLEFYNLKEWKDLFEINLRNGDRRFARAVSAFLPLTIALRLTVVQRIVRVAASHWLLFTSMIYSNDDTFVVCNEA